ncbi:MAG: protein translocase SEC61 complex subunit gamma [Candidatus Woesearchaeota archaeon]
MEGQIKQTMWQRLGSYIIECKRVLRVTKKPDQEEFKAIVKVSGLGILVIGAIGFLVQLISMIFIKQ